MLLEMCHYMTPQQKQRDQELKEETDREIEDEQRAAAALFQGAGDGVATDGSLLFVSRQNGLRRNYGDNSNIGRQQYAEALDSEQPTAKKPPPSKVALLALSYSLTTSVTTSVFEFSTICVHK
jgi:hypothetical protein